MHRPINAFQNREDITINLKIKKGGRKQKNPDFTHISSI